MRMLSGLLTRFIHNGVLELTDATGGQHRFGGEGPGPTVHVTLHDPALHTRLAWNPELYAGEAYMDGTLTLGDGEDVGDLLRLFSINRSGLGAHASQQVLRRMLRVRAGRAGPCTLIAQSTLSPVMRVLIRMHLQEHRKCCSPVFGCEHTAGGTITTVLCKKANCSV